MEHIPRLRNECNKWLVWMVAMKCPCAVCKRIPRKPICVPLYSVQEGYEFRIWHRTCYIGFLEWCNLTDTITVVFREWKKNVASIQRRNDRIGRRVLTILRHWKQSKYEKWAVSAMEKHLRQLLQVYFRDWAYALAPPLVSSSDDGHYGVDDGVEDETDDSSSDDVKIGYTSAGIEHLLAKLGIHRRTK